MPNKGLIWVKVFPRVSNKDLHHIRKKFPKTLNGSINLECLGSLDSFESRYSFKMKSPFCPKRLILCNLYYPEPLAIQSLEAQEKLHFKFLSIRHLTNRNFGFYIFKLRIIMNWLYPVDFNIKGPFSYFLQLFHFLNISNML